MLTAYEIMPYICRRNKGTTRNDFYSKYILVVALSYYSRSRKRSTYVLLRD